MLLLLLLLLSTMLILVFIDLCLLSIPVSNVFVELKNHHLQLEVLTLRLSLVCTLDLKNVNSIILDLVPHS